MQTSVFESDINMFDSIKNSLLKQQEDIESKLSSLAQEEDALGDDVPESQELGTSSWQEDVRSSRLAVKVELLGLSKKIKQAILKINQGSYGKCENCKKYIEPSRLQLVPTTTFCIVCKK